LRFRANGKEVDVRFNMLSRNAIQVTIGPPKLSNRFSILLGQSSTIDADADGIPDFKMTLHSAVGYRAQVHVIPLTQPAQNPITSFVPEEKENKKVEVKEEVKAAPVEEKPVVKESIKKNRMEYPKKKAKNYLWYISPIALFFVLLLAGYFKYNSANLIQVSKNMMKMKAYIRNNKAKGYSDEQIRKILMGYYSERQIDEAFKEFNEQTNIPRSIIK